MPDKEISMPRSRTAVAVLLALAVILVIVGVLYQTGNLQVATSANGKHVKYAVLCYGLAVLCLVGAWSARPEPA
ncbi:MAG TPA: hypothetical protein VI316_06080 [Candidatus Dormibacteraeota bacterium]